jgi:hypothetical protein
LLTLDDNHRFGQAEVAYYITDAFKVYAGYRYINETSFGAAGSEYLIRGMDVPVALFARGDFGDEDFNSITGGLRVYLSDDPQKSLIDRHRRDDPKVYAPTFPTLAANNPTQVPQCTVDGFNHSRERQLHLSRRVSRGNEAQSERWRRLHLPDPLN